MTRMVQCTKLNKQAAGLAAAPYPGELGQRIFNHISAEAWKSWLRQQTMLINEYRLSVVDPRARAMLEGEMKKFLFGEA
jgi:Fe-S cluster biosynthesis and repair protein YggX